MTDAVLHVQSLVKKLVKRSVKRDHTNEKEVTTPNLSPEYVLSYSYCCIYYCAPHWHSERCIIQQTVLWLERDILRESRVSHRIFTGMEFRFSPIPQDGREWFSCWRERSVTVCSLWCWHTDGADSLFKHPREECEQRVKRRIRLVPAVSRD